MTRFMPTIQTPSALADTMLYYARASGYYTLLGGGDTNLYGLVLERALDLIRRRRHGGFAHPVRHLFRPVRRQFFWRDHRLQSPAGPVRL